MSDPSAPVVVEVTTTTPEHTRALGAALASILEVGDLLLLSGDLGAGKTCLTQGIGAGLGVVDRITSPTFTIAAEYEGRLTLHHLDVYRLDDPSETLDLDLPELLESGVTVIEWGDEIDAVLPTERLTIRLAYDVTVESGVVGERAEAGADDRRRVELVAEGEGWIPRAGALAALTAVADPVRQQGSEPC